MESTTAFDGTQESFELFCDKLAQIFPQAQPTLNNNPIFSGPYIIISMVESYAWDSYTLIVDKGQFLYKNSKGEGQVGNEVH